MLKWGYEWGDEVGYELVTMTAGFVGNASDVGSKCKSSDALQRNDFDGVVRQCRFGEGI